MSMRSAARALGPTLAGLALVAVGCTDQPRPLEPAALAPTDAAARAVAQAVGPTLVDGNLAVRTAASGLVQPTAMAFIGPRDFLVIEKASGRVLRFRDGIAMGPVLDLAVNSFSERGLLGIAVHPDFPANPSVFLFWTESTTGADSPLAPDVPLLGNRIDRFVWNGSSLALASNLIRLRSFQADAGQPLRGNHHGGVLEFGPDAKLYAFFGDQGRRGWLQNLPCGPTPTCPGPIVPDDQFGGPQPDNAHMSGVVLRLNTDGTAPTDNPFYGAGAAMGGEVGANVQKVYSYGHRNSFGMAFDPEAGTLWLQENGDDSFTELNRVTPGMDGGWVQIAGPVSRVAEFRAIETSAQFFGLQQLRWSPVNIATTPAQALARLFLLPGAHYEDPALAWKFEIAPAGLGFIRGRALGPQYDGDLVMGASRETLAQGYLFRFNLTGNRRAIGTDDPRLADRVADNLAKFDITESESLLFGSDFGVGTDVQTGPNGNLFVVSLSDGVVYEIYRRK